MPPESSTKLNSLISILNKLDKGTRITATFLAESLNVTERTIYRYMMTLQNANYPIFFDRKKMSYRFVDGFSLKSTVNQTEIFKVLDLKSRMLGSTSVGLASYDSTGQCIIANNAVASIIGTSYEQILSQNYMELESWKKSGMLIIALDVMHNGNEIAGEFHLFTRYAKEVWLHCSMSRFTQNGQNYLLLVVQDVTERKKLEQSIKESEELLALFVENSPAYPSVAPERLPDFGYQQSERFGLASNWSERHAAFVAGLGTFGLSDAMITRWGKAVRLGSVVSRIHLPASKRVYGDDHHAWCLWYAKGTCGACAKRCPADAITTIEGHDKQTCFNYIRGTTAPYATRTYGTGATPCGLCQVKIPCEAQVPAALLEENLSKGINNGLAH